MFDVVFRNRYAGTSNLKIVTILLRLSVCFRKFTVFVDKSLVAFWISDFNADTTGTFDEFRVF